MPWNRVTLFFEDYTDMFSRNGGEKVPPDHIREYYKEILDKVGVEHKVEFIRYTMAHLVVEDHINWCIENCEDNSWQWGVNLRSQGCIHDVYIDFDFAHEDDACLFKLRFLDGA